VGRLRIARDNTPHGRGFRGTDELWLVVVPFHRLRTAMLCCDNITLMIEQYRACGVLYVSNPLTSRMYFVLDFVPIAGTDIFLCATIVPSFILFALEYGTGVRQKRSDTERVGEGEGEKVKDASRDDFVSFLSNRNCRIPLTSRFARYGVCQQKTPFKLGKASAQEVLTASPSYTHGDCLLSFCVISQP